ncbi:MAG: NDP-sugar synthase [Myxococcales bacterium]|nr:NDP-sugar synthase [Myxococcales bacterium]
MRAMILAAGLGTRLRPLSALRAKPALPVLGRPVISLLLELLARHGVREVLINLHHLPETIRSAVAGDCPDGIEVEWSEEPRPLGTGGGIRRAADFLRGSPECVVLAGDMLFDADLAALARTHRRSGRGATLVLRDDPRADRFGSIGLDETGGIVRVGRRRVEGATRPEARSGLFSGLRFFSRACLEGWPAAEAFEDLRDWLVPAIESAAISAGGVLLPASSSVWEPVGTPQEYLEANLDPPALPSLGGEARRWSGPVDRLGPGDSVIVDRSARLGVDVQLERCVVWDGERVADSATARDAVFAGGRFHPCTERASIQPGETGAAEGLRTGRAAPAPSRDETAERLRAGCGSEA